MEIGRTADLTVAPSVNAAGTNCNFLGRSQVPGHYALRGTLRNFRVYDRALSADEAIALSEAPGVPGVQADAAAIDLGLTSRHRRRHRRCPPSGPWPARASPGPAPTRPWSRPAVPSPVPPAGRPRRRRR